ncbi:hypothetical protein CSUI_004616 [Cystoisospora suis]|uniref:Uncharacterized protein n=1 Tax=Cystoisospora suis TaxID=483139 RepID=A0A2C6L098_9APIC|nr:hypothetical protein CSUI_004616 [Cystoisospora suis]
MPGYLDHLESTLTQHAFVMKINVSYSDLKHVSGFRSMVYHSPLSLVQVVVEEPVHSPVLPLQETASDPSYDDDYQVVLASLA